MSDVAANEPVSSPGGPAVLFFDLEALLKLRSGQPPRVRPHTRHLLTRSGRAGIIAFAPRFLAREIDATLDMLGIGGFFDPGLIVEASSLPVKPFDPRAFAVAAALAAVPIARCLYVAPDEPRAAAAARAGMAVTLVGPRSAGATALSPARPEDALEQPVALIDHDTGPTFVLEGRIVTMTRRGAFEGRVGVRRGRIAAVLRWDEPLPPSLRSAPLLRVDGSIYPGLVDLHNHYVYNIAPLWRVPERYENRDDWADVASKKAEVSLPVNLLAGWAPTARAIVRYVEAKALIGGTTTGQGIRTQVRGGVGLFRGAMRNVESTDDPRLPEAATLVPTMGRRPEDIAAFRAALEKRLALGGGYFYHLAEGTDDLARRTYTDLRDHGLLRSPLVAIHALALRRPDLRLLGDAGAKVVWSPFSNLLLYGQTLDLRAVLASRARLAVGCDWTPSGSRNLFQELKVARHVVRAQGLEARLGSERLVRAVTADAAAILGWARYVGALRPGAMADLLVLAGREGDDYDRLIDATERDVRLVVVHGAARYGDRQLMESVDANLGQPPEALEVDGSQKAFQLVSPASPLNGLTLAEATRTLRDALEDLHAFRDVVSDGIDRLRALGVEPQDTFSLLLDNEGDGAGEDAAFRDLALTDFSLLPRRLELDGLVVGGDDYWSRIVDQPNIDRSLKDELRAAYGR